MTHMILIKQYIRVFIWCFNILKTTTSVLYTGLYILKGMLFCTVSSAAVQGSMLGPLIFIMYLNDTPLWSKIFKCIIYAHDITLIANFSDKKISRINTWCRLNKISNELSIYGV